MPAPKGNKFAAGNKGGGRPSAYKPEFARAAAKMCDLGAVDADLADAFGVNVSTINAWKAAHEEFSQALKMKANADARVERSLFQRAVGYSYDAVHFSAYQGVVTRTEYREHCPPDTTAAIFWLKNRRPEEWRDKQHVEHAVDNSIASLLERVATNGRKLVP